MTRARPLAFVARRLLQVLVIALATTALNFFLLRLAPGDAAEVIAGQSGAATPEYLAALREQFGLDQPLATQFARYFTHVMRLDLGHSFRFGQSVASLIADRLPATLLLMGASLAIAVVVGCALGALAASRAGKLTDSLISSLALLFYATPLFWIGLMLVVVFSVWLDWLPIGGMIDVQAQHQGWARAVDVLRHLVLPAVTLSLFYMAVYVRLMRGTLIEIGHQDFIRTAVAKGLRPGRILWRHRLRNAWLPVVTMLGVQIGSVLGGAVLVETVFAWPGLGRLAFDALFARDLNLLLGILLCSSIVVLLLNLIVDLLYRVIDPRIELN